VSAEALRVEPDFAIPRHELTVRATRAGGPGGQHVNTSSTRIELLWNVERSRAPSAEQRVRLREKLAARLDAEGNVRVLASAYRSQLRNREDAEERLVALVRKALHVAKARRKTRPHRGAVQARLDAKRRASRKKQLRRDSGEE
jgi:ribosome-associated protein